jgi:hypothetical protein
MRSRANTAPLLAESSILMRLKELEVLEKVAASGKLSGPGRKGSDRQGCQPDAACPPYCASDTVGSVSAGSCSSGRIGETDSR